MIKKSLLVLCLLVMFVGYVGAVETMIQSEDYTADAAVRTSSGVFYGMWVITDGANNVTVSVYDNASAASGTKIFPTTIIPVSDTGAATTISFNPPIKYTKGVYVDITTSGTVTYKVYYKDGN